MQALVFSVLRNQTWLDHVIGTLRKGKLDVEARLILQLGLSQLFLLGMADHAAVYETVNLASVRLRGLVNAILRNALRREKTILEDREKLPLSIHYSTPAWLVQRWTEQMGAANDPRPAPLEQYHTAPVCARQSFDTHEKYSGLPRTAGPRARLVLRGRPSAAGGN